MASIRPIEPKGAFELSESVLVDVRELSKRFSSGTLAIDGLTVEIPRGKTIGLIGPNGAGKTTFMSLIAGLLRPSSGHIIWHSVSGERDVRFAPQNPTFPKQSTVLECIQLYGSLDGFRGTPLQEECKRVLNAVALWEERTKFAEQLSEGMKKRLSVAQALLGAPELVLLDEPTAMLDPENAVRIRHVIRAKSPAQTVLVSSHNLAEVEEYCDDVIILQAGKYVPHAPESMSTSTTLQLTGKHPLPETWIAELERWQTIEYVEWQTGNRFVRLTAARTDAPRLLGELSQSAHAAGIEVQSIQQGETLEEKFLRATR